jgi:hypothetical protein
LAGEVREGHGGTAGAGLSLDAAANPRRFRLVKDAIDRVLATVDTLRTLARERVREAKQTTEREVMAAALVVNQVVAAATTHIGSWRALARRLGGEGGDEAVQGQLDTQREVVDAFLRKLALQVEAQQELVLRALARADSIAASGGVDAKTQGLTSEMRALLPGLVITGEGIRDLSRTFEVAFQRSSTGIREALRERGRQVLAVLRSSDTTLLSIARGQQDALSHLQFQDVVAQGLDRLDTRFHECQVQLMQVLGVAERSAALFPPSHRELGGDKSIDHSKAGEVLLF